MRHPGSARILTTALLSLAVLTVATDCSSTSTSQVSTSASSAPIAVASSSGQGSSPAMTASHSTGPASSSLPSYDGAELKLLGEIPAPAIKAGHSFKVGFLQVNGAVGNLRAVQSAAAAQVAKLGGTMIALDAQLSPQTQISQFQQLISQKVDAILVLPAVDSSLNPSMKQAQAAGIPVITYGLPVDKAQPANPYVATSVNVGFDYGAYSIAKNIASKNPGSTFAILGVGLPVPTLQYIDSQMKTWGVRMGLKFVGEEDALTDDTNGYGPAAQAILTKYPDVQNILAFNDESALFMATQAVQKSNNTVKISVVNGGEDIARQAIMANRMYSDYFMRWGDLGTDMVNASYQAVTKQGTPPTGAVLKSEVVTKDNIDAQRPWAK